MRWPAALFALLLTACIPGGGGGDAPPSDYRPPDAQAATGREATLQCHLDLAREGVQFRALPDRRFENGCTAIGAVQLVDVGVPTANVTAMTCPVARQYGRWLREAVQPAASQILGTTVTRVETFGTYACRTVNSQPGARLSEHAYANAIDISGFALGNGRRISVVDGWNGDDERVRRFLRTIHREGCRRFSVGLGPDSDRAHYNHLHFDAGPRGTCR